MEEIHHYIKQYALAQANTSRDINFGSAALRIHYQNSKYFLNFIEVFRLWPEHETSLPAPVFDLYFLENSELYSSLERIAQSEKRQTETILHSPLVHLTVMENELFFVFHPQGKPDQDVRYYQMILWNKFIFRLGKLHMHAAALQIGNKTAVLIGDKGTGKTSISIAAGLKGGTILSEDHTLISEFANGFQVSGCDGYTRITKETEKYFFHDSLPDEAKDFAGVSKKEVQLKRFVKAEPFMDHPVDLIFFPTVNDAFSIQSKSSMTAVLYSLDRLRHGHRFYDAADYESFIDYLSRFYNSASVYDLKLSPDLRDIDQLLEFIQHA